MTSGPRRCRCWPRGLATAIRSSRRSASAPTASRRPSPGSVYPALQQLEDEGLIRAETSESGRKAFTLTDEGRAYADSHADELAASWDAVTGSVDGAEVELRGLVRQVLMAVSQVGQAGSAAQVKEAAKVLTDTRRSLYRILAADGEDEAASPAE